MSLTLRIALILVSFLVILFVLKRIRRTKLYIDDAIYWIIFSVLLFVISIFPQIAIFAAELLGIQSPANFVFLLIIFVVLIKLFNLSIELSVQRHRLNRLVQKLALMNESERMGRHSGESSEEVTPRERRKKSK